MNATERYTRDGDTVTVRTRDERVLVTPAGNPTEEITSTNAARTARTVTRALVRDGYQRKGKR